MSPAREQARRLPDSLGTEHLVVGEGDRLDEYSVARLHMTLCGTVVEERIATGRCPDCAEAARRRGLRIES